MEYLQVAIRLLLAGLIDGPASVFVGATGGRKISFAASSPAGELAAPTQQDNVSNHLVPKPGTCHQRAAWRAVGSALVVQAETAPT